MANLRWSLAVVTLLLVSAAPALAQQASPAGRIKTVTGSAFIVRGRAVVPAQAGQVVYEADALRTGAAAVRYRIGSRIGPGTLRL